MMDIRNKMNKNSKAIKKIKKDWRDGSLTPNDKLRMQYALAEYLIDTKQEKKLPPAVIATVREIIPYLAEEDERWETIDPARVTTAGYPIYKDLSDIIRNTLNSVKELQKHITYVKDRIKKQEIEDEEAEDE